MPYRSLETSFWQDLGACWWGILRERGSRLQWAVTLAIILGCAFLIVVSRLAVMVAWLLAILITMFVVVRVVRMSWES